MRRPGLSSARSMQTTTQRLIIVLLACLALANLGRRFSNAVGSDFYHYWGISQARAWSESDLGNPYLESERYAKVLNSHSDRSRAQRLQTPNRYRRDLDLTGTPLLYSIFFALPEDYSLAFGLFQLSQMTLFVAAILWLGALYRADGSAMAILALLLAVAYEPLLSDLRVGNVNSIQLFALTGVLFFADRTLPGRSARDTLVLGSCFLCAVVTLTLLKPNLALVTIALTVHLWARYGSANLLLAALPALALGAALVIAPCLYFDSWTLWGDWYELVYGGDRGHLFYPVLQGNYAAAMLVARRLGIDALSASLGLAGLLAGSGLIGLLARPVSGPAIRARWDAVRTALRDPHLCLAVGVCATLAVAPLLWLHYYLISLIPALWLLLGRLRWPYAAPLGALAIALSSGTISNLFLFVGWEEWIPASYAISWLPLWIGALAAFVSMEPERTHTSLAGIVTRE